MTYLLDTNALIALAWENHVHHTPVTRWLRGVKSFATCPFTQGGFIRISSNPAVGYANEPADVFLSLDSIIKDSRHEFWPDELSFGAKGIHRPLIRSHTQVTDHYLVALARLHQGSLATFDVTLARAFGKEQSVVTLIK
jgi:toxin-antitoxin system PIN domain toxin